MVIIIKPPRWSPIIFVKIILEKVVSTIIFQAQLQVLQILSLIYQSPGLIQMLISWTFIAERACLSLKTLMIP